MAELKLMLSQLVREVASTGREGTEDGEGEARSGAHTVAGTGKGRALAPPGVGIGSGPSHTRVTGSRYEICGRRIASSKYDLGSQWGPRVPICQCEESYTRGRKV